jgi:hypothetical protein
MRSKHNCLLLSLLSFKKKGKTSARIFLDANLIQVAPECRDTGGLACLYCGTFSQKCILSEVIKENLKENMLGVRVP